MLSCQADLPYLYYGLKPGWSWIEYTSVAAFCPKLSLGLMGFPNRGTVE